MQVLCQVLSEALPTLLIGSSIAGVNVPPPGISGDWVMPIDANGKFFVQCTRVTFCVSREVS